MKIYTKTGDQGKTSLVGGIRLSKDVPCIKSYGEVDELNSWLGVCIVELSKSFRDSDEYSNQLQNIQQNLFVLGSNLACEEKGRSKLPQLQEQDISKLEQAIDEMDAKLPSLKNFILPGGSTPGAFLHMARTCCRRAERSMVEMGEPLPLYALAYINRLSDFLFVLARYTNFSLGVKEHLWKGQEQ